jgi:hypothetical protein
MHHTLYHIVIFFLGSLFRLLMSSFFGDSYICCVLSRLIHSFSFRINENVNRDNAQPIRFRIELDWFHIKSK